MEIVRDCLRHVQREPMRMLLTLLGIMIGSGSVVLLASTLRAATFALNHASQEATGDDITRVERRPAGPALMARSAPGLSDRDARAMAEREGVAIEHSSAAAMIHHQNASIGQRTKPVGVQSGGQRYGKLSGLIRTVKIADSSLLYILFSVSF